jgi:hypothetical protein
VTVPLLSSALTETQDLNVGNDYLFYGKVFHTTRCDAFTEVPFFIRGGGGGGGFVVGAL